MFNRAFFLTLILVAFAVSGYAQTATQQSAAHPNTINSTKDDEGTDSSNVLTLKDCLKYALRNQPALRQSLIDESIAKTNNGIALSSWLPQIGGAANYQHYFQLPIAFSTINGVLTPIQSGVFNTSTPSVTATQTIFSPDVLLATRAARLNILGARQNTADVKINVVTDVSKAFYDLLLSIQQIGVFKDDTARLKKNQSDAYNQYVSGIVDKVD